jgi:hypothetical protein
MDGDAGTKRGRPSIGSPPTRTEKESTRRGVRNRPKPKPIRKPPAMTLVAGALMPPVLLAVGSGESVLAVFRHTFPSVSGRPPGYAGVAVAV